MRSPIRLVLELVRKQSLSLLRGIRGVLPRAPGGYVNELALVYYRRGTHALHLRAEFEEEIGFLRGLVRGHADVCFIPQCSRECGEGDTCRADGAFVDGIPVVRGDEALLLCAADYGESNPVFGGLPCGVEEFGFGEDVAACGLAEGFDTEEGRVAYAALDAIGDFGDGGHGTDITGVIFEGDFLG